MARNRHYHGVGLRTGLPPDFLMNIPRKLPLASAAALVALLTPLSAQQDWVAWSFVNGANDTDQFSIAIEPVGDWNQDGYDDYAASSPGSDLPFHNGGLVTIHSGEDDSIIASINSQASGEQIGYCLESLGTHDADGLPKLAIGAPFASTSAGPFSGLVRIYAWDNASSSLSLVDQINGALPGDMFGASVAGFDSDGDGDMDLAVGAIGVNFQDGQVLTYDMSSAGAAQPAAATYDGASGSGEMFGWSLTRADTSGIGQPTGSNAEGLAVGVPFATDLASESGVVVLIDESGVMTQLSSPLESVANAHLGYSIDGGMDALGDTTTDLAAGAPDTANGNVLVWSGDNFSLGYNLAGDNAGDRYGFSLAMIPDTDFDDKADIAAGAPGFQSERGSFRANEVAAAGEVLYSANGISGSSGQFGFSINGLGDINQTGKQEVGVGAPFVGNNRGRIETFAPPAQDIGPITLTATGSFNWGTDVIIDATNLAEGSGGDLYWYVGTSLQNVVSNDGFNVGVSNGGGTPPTRYALTVSPGTAAQTSMEIEDHIDDGTVLYYQLVENRSGFVRISNIDGGMVHDPGVSIFVDGNQAPGTATISTRWGHPNSPVYFYASPIGATPGATNTVPGNNWKVNLINPIALGVGSYQSGAIGAPDEGDATTGPLSVPAAASGRTIYFQAMDWDLFSKQLTNVITVDFQ